MAPSDFDQPTEIGRTAVKRDNSQASKTNTTGVVAFLTDDNLS